MAVRIRSRFHTAGPRSPATLASVVAVLAWKLAIDAIQRLRDAGYDIDIGRTYFDFVVEYTTFVAHAADRVAHRLLDEALRHEFTTALALRLAEIMADNHEMLLGAATPDECRQNFIAVFNHRGADYGEYDYGEDGPSFGFRRMFGAALAEILPEKDKLWVIDQAMDIEAPTAIEALERTLKGLFAPTDAAPARRSNAAAGNEEP